MNQITPDSLEALNDMILPVLCRQFENKGYIEKIWGYVWGGSYRDVEKSLKNSISEPFNDLFNNLFVPEAAFNMIIHHAGGLHVRIDNCRPDKLKSSFF